MFAGFGHRRGTYERIGNLIARGFENIERKLMLNRIGTIVGLVVIALPMLAGCASNTSQVRTRSALDLDCDVSNVNVQLTERPYIGVTRYEATGCGETQSYVCRAQFYSVGLPLGKRTCKRAGERPDPVISPQGVMF